MIRDTIVEEVRAIHDEIAKAHDYNVDAIFESLRNRPQRGRDPSGEN